MKSKNILLAGLAVSALAAATGAHALSLSGTQVGGTTVVSGGATPVVAPYYLASETTVPSGGLTGNAKIDAHLTTGTITSGTFLVTYSISGGTFNTSAISNTNLTYGGAAGTTSTTVSTLNSTSVSFIVTVSGNATITDFNFQPAPIVVAAPGSVSFTASITSGGVPVDNGPSSATVISATPGYAATVTGKTDQIASVASNFKLFKNNGASTSSCAAAAPNDCATAQIGTLNLAVATTPTGGAGIFKDLASTPVQNSDITGAIVTATGNVGPTEALKVGTTTVVPGTPTNVTAGGPASLPVTLNQLGATAATQSPLAQNGYSIAAMPTLNTGVGVTSSLASTFTNTLGSVTYEGINLKAAWVGDGSNGFDFRIRIGNYGAAIVGAVQVTLLNPLNTGTSGVVASNVPCTIQTGISAGGEANISSAALKTCFGAFGRSDLLVTIQGSSTALTAKMRIINGTTGVVNEQTLGFGVTVAQQN